LLAGVLDLPDDEDLINTEELGGDGDCGPEQKQDQADSQ
jgi:hypothetical protein